MPDVTDEIDEMVRAAAKAHEGLAGADYFDALPARVLARLESRHDEVSMMSDTNAKDSDSNLHSSGGDSLAGAGGPTDDSGLHDMKALAQTAKQRISRRITSQHDAYNDQLLSSSQSGLRAVALPVQAQIVSLPDLPGTATATATAAAIDGVPAATPISAAGPKKSKAIWLVGGGLLAAAAVAAVIVTGGGKKNGAAAEQGRLAAVESGTSAVSGGAPSMTPPTGAAQATGAPGATTVTAVAPEPATPSQEAAIAAADGKAERPADRGAADKQQRAAGGAGSSGEKRDASETADKAGGKSDPTVTAPKVKAGKPDEKKPGGGEKAAAGEKPPASGGAPAGGGGDSIEDLLNQASGGAQKPSEGGGGGGGEAKPDKTGLDGKDIKAGMSSVAGKAQGCFDQHGVAGHVKVKVTIDPSGKVTKADATGEFAGTPTGQCVAAAVKGASFATWNGAPMSVSYGFTLVE